MTDFKLKIVRTKVVPEEKPLVKHLQKFFIDDGAEQTISFCIALADSLAPFTARYDDASDGTICDELEKLSGYTFYVCDHDELELNDAKWYGRDKDMAQLSALYPCLKFLLSGDGEEQGDVWKMSWQAGKPGKRQVAKMVFDDED